jgi:hypothetical protein
MLQKKREPNQHSKVAPRIWELRNQVTNQALSRWVHPTLPEAAARTVRRGRLSNPTKSSA